MTDSSSAKVADDTQSSEEWVLVGEVSAPFGVRGQVKMRPLLDDPKALVRLPSVRVRYPNGREETRRVSAVQKHQDVARVTLDGISDRDLAETLRGALVYIRKAELPPLGEDAYYAEQLIGLRVVTEAGRDLGVIEEVHFYPANDVYETADAMIPAIADVIVQVDVPGGRLLVRDIPGLHKNE